MLSGLTKHFFIVGTYFLKGTCIAKWTNSDTMITTEEDKTMMGKWLIFVRHDLFKLLWCLQWGYGLHDSKPIWYSMNMCINSYHFLTKQRMQDNFCCLLSNSLQSYQFFKCMRNLIGVVSCLFLSGSYLPCCISYIFWFAICIVHRPNQWEYVFWHCLTHRRSIRIFCEKLRRDHIDTFICRLSWQHNSCQKLVRRAIVQLCCSAAITFT